MYRTSRPIKNLFYAVLILLSLVGELWADDSFSPMTMNEQVETLKKEMLDLGRDITVLEDVLMYPAETRVSVYLAADSGNYFTIDKVKLLLNGKLVKTYEYNDREKKGFVKGSAQRLFIGNLRQGKHKLVAFVEGIGPRGRHYKRGAVLQFIKQPKAQIFKLLIEDDAHRQKPNFVIKEYS